MTTKVGWMMPTAELLTMKALLLKRKVAVMMPTVELLTTKVGLSTKEDTRCKHAGCLDTPKKPTRNHRRATTFV